MFTEQSNIAVPSNLITMGYVSGAYGIKGWVRIKSYSTNTCALNNAKIWWLQQKKVNSFKKIQTKYFNKNLVAQLVGVYNRNIAETLKGAIIQIARSYFPVLSNNEFYWIDLIGATVKNLQGKHLGYISNILDNKAHAILQIAILNKEEINCKNKITPNIFIPFVCKFIKIVKIEEKVIIVDWKLNY